MNSLMLAMVVFAFVGAVTPGPVNLLATSTAINRGMKEALKHVMGASIAYAMVVFFSGSVMQTIALLLPKLEFAMQISGSAFLLYLAVRIYTAPVSAMEMTSSQARSWWVGALTQLLNPKAWLVAMSGVSLYVLGQENPTSSLILFTSVSLIVCFVGVGIWAVIGQILASKLENPTQQRQFNKVMAVLLGVSVSLIWL
ncbi:LysE family translocator [Vibrio sp. 10N.261.55.A7]|uniref:LysE family translocator n=1 Tax=Vibrio sp. 10N.261.55.A7 TaxID=1880851 RepID=UPI000C81677F|nr:LysE family translocator [Vibrio sp. 10N.261.55.A7]PMJ91745.1 transporter [Vibrio sp. 10N.261.55.A7]